MVDRKAPPSTPKSPSQLPGLPTKGMGGIQITPLPGAGAASKTPAAKPASPQPAGERSLAFGEVDLGGSDEPLPEMASQEKAPAKAARAPAAKPGAPAPRPPLKAKAEEAESPVEDAEPVAPPPEKERPYIRVHSSSPKRDSGKIVRLVVIVVVALAVLGGAIFGVMKFIESRKLAQEEEIKKLDRSSLDRLKNEAARNQGITP